MALPNLQTETSRALTFTVGDSLFGIDVSHILSFSDSYPEIKYASQKVDGFVGYLDFRNSLVRVFECATSLSRGKERDALVSLIDQIKTYKQAHIDWITALEHSVVSGEPFVKPRDPRMCAFGQWFYSFSTEDDGLRTLLEKIEQPHIHIHSLADKLLDQTASGEKEAAVEILRIEKQTTLKKLLRILDYISDYLNNSIHPIVLHLTKDGRTPWFSMVLDDLGDIIDYAPETLDTVSDFNSAEPIVGYVRDPSGPNFMMLSLDKFYEKANSKVTEEP
jgi:chemotaxis signal transduction protein